MTLVSVICSLFHSVPSNWIEIMYPSGLHILWFCADLYLIKKRFVQYEEEDLKPTETKSPASDVSCHKIIYKIISWNWIYHKNACLLISSWICFSLESDIFHNEIYPDLWPLQNISWPMNLKTISSCHKFLYDWCNLILAVKEQRINKDCDFLPATELDTSISLNWQICSNHLHHKVVLSYFCWSWLR